MRVLELFSGTGTLSRLARERGHEAFTIDLLQPADLNTDVYGLHPADIMAFTRWPKPDMVWASPPCAGFSVASIGKSWHQPTPGIYKPKSESAYKSLALLVHTMNLIGALNPTVWYVENPRGMARKMAVMQPYLRHTVTYCQYGENRMKPTDIWTNNLSWQPRAPCKAGDSCHEAAPRGSRTGTQGERSPLLRAKLPDELCVEVLTAAEAMLENHERS